MKLKEFTKGIIRQNPVLVLVIGLCPTLAITTRVENAIGMAAALAFVLISSNLLISAMRNFIPREVRIPAYIVVIASFVTTIEFIIHGSSPAIYQQLGIFLPLITVNCIVLGRAEAFASKRPMKDTLLDTAGMSVGFAVIIFVISAIREFFGTGHIVVFGQEIVPTILSSPAGGMILPAGAFLTMGALLAILKRLKVL
jgi:electron transport complex protein RnfE